MALYAGERISTTCSAVLALYRIMTDSYLSTANTRLQWRIQKMKVWTEWSATRITAIWLYHFRPQFSILCAIRLRWEGTAVLHTCATNKTFRRTLTNAFSVWNQTCTTHDPETHTCTLPQRGTMPPPVMAACGPPWIRRSSFTARIASISDIFVCV